MKTKLPTLQPTLLDLQTQTATHLSAVEIGLGSVLHSFKVPFTGHFLSLNQGFFLTRFVRTQTKSVGSSRSIVRSVFEISVIASLLKSLSPAGQKLGPMLSLSMQGVMYSIGILVFGANPFGTTLGLVLLALWAFVQPFITLFITFGFELVKAVQFYIERLNKDFNVSSENLFWVVLAAVTIKVTFAVGISLSSWLLKPESLDRIQQKIQSHKPAQVPIVAHKNIHRLVMRDLTRPLFIISFLLTFTFLFLTEESVVTFFWKCLRPLAVAVLLFYALRSPRTQKVLQALAQRSSYLGRLYLNAQTVLNQLRN